MKTVKVTSADFNGIDWDGCPFSEITEWLMAAISVGRITMNTHGHTDYSRWDVSTPRGVVTAEPGDNISTDIGGNLFVEKVTP